MNRETVMSVKIKINGDEFQARKGESVLGVARRNGIWIPSLCHNDNIPDYGACRLCLIELVARGRRKVTTSCTLPAADGLEVFTESDRLTRLRRLVMELILAGCPENKQIAEMAEKLGVKGGRLAANKQNDCILCGLCVRACSGISRAEAISFINRGIERKVSTAFGEVSRECILCGACVSVCPTGSRLLNLARIAGEEPRALLSRFDAGLAGVRAIARPFPQAVPNVPAINPAACLKLNRDACGICEKVCEARAIVYKDTDKIRDIRVGAIIAAPGFETFVPDHDFGLGYRSNPDVVTSMEFERFLSASGPFGGHIHRPSDGKEPRRIAFIQCVGSRDISCRNGYCSSVCCMFAVKEAIIAREHLSTVNSTIFVMDVRAFGKDFDRFVERAKSEYGIGFVYARVSDVIRDRTTGQSDLIYADASGQLRREKFDLVVLSVGMEPSDSFRELTRKLGVRLNEFGFIRADVMSPLCTSRAGVFAAGSASGPSDIPETVIQAGAAACEAGRLLRAARGTLTVERKFPPERAVVGEPVRIGVFVCHCGINIGGIVNVPRVRDYAATLPGVVFASDNLYTCSQDTQKLIIEHIRGHDLNRIVVASCSPRTHESLFQETLREAGLNPHLLAMTNIRDQCSWVHQREPEAATQKAKDLVHMAVARARLTEPLTPVILPVTHKAMVIGGGFAGMTGALAIADHGFEVCLVEKEKKLGGHLRDLQAMLGGQDLQALLASTVERVKHHPQIRVHINATVREIRGFVGNYESVLSNGVNFKHGAILVTTGASEYRPTEYGYGQSAKIVTQTEFSDLLAKGLVAQPDNIVMIQCVGSREEPRQYCSRVCCSKAVQNAIRVKELFPAVNVYVLYRDIRTYGYRELYYTEARDKGVLFIRFDLDHRPEVIVDGSSAGINPAPAVIVKDVILEQQLKIKADYVVLSTGIVADHEANDALARQLKVPINQDGFFMEAHAKLRPVEFATDGVYVAGLAHSPKAVEESMTQALAAASRVCVLLAQKELDAHGTVCNVNPDRCMACGLCEKVCAFSAIGMELQHIGKQERLLPRINLALCKGCGACAASCRCGAIILGGCTEEQVIAEIMAL